MNDLADQLPEGRLSNLLREAAERVGVRPDIGAVVDETTVYPRLIERPNVHRVPSIVFLATASAAALAVGLAVVVPTVRDRSVDPGVQPAEVDPTYRNHTDVYPLLTDTPAWAGDLTANVLRASGATQRRLLALVARRGQDSLKAPIIISSGEPTTLDVADGESLGDVAGYPAFLFGDAGALRTVLVTDADGAVLLALSGLAEPDVLVAVLEAVTVHESDSAPTFTIGELPAGLDVVVEPTVQPRAVDSFGIATSADATADGTLAIEVVTDLSDLRFYSSRDGAPDLRSIFIGGTGEQLTAWYTMPTADSVVLAWKLDPGIALVLTATRDGITPSEAIRIASDVVLTDQATWSDAYDAAAIIAATEASD